MKILIVAGARPNFVKIAPLVRAFNEVLNVTPILVHTGQHYDASMSDRQFEDLQLPPPDYHLGVGSGTHAQQTAQVMVRIEPVLDAEEPDIVVVVGDVNSTVAAALTAAKRGTPVAHVEAGLRSFDRTMPEEINRIVTDAISDLLFVSEVSGLNNLLSEGTDPESIRFVGNVMIDALEFFRPKWSASDVGMRLGVEEGRYAMLTLHRPSNVDDPGTLDQVMGAVLKLSRRIPILYPVHPRVRPRLAAMHELARHPGLICVEPLGYLDCIALMSRASLVLTDSGGVQEETTALGVPCLTLRSSTERPVTTTSGTNRVVGTDPDAILRAARSILIEPPSPPAPPPLWDGHAALRIARILETALERARSHGHAPIPTYSLTGLPRAVAFP